MTEGWHNQDYVILFDPREAEGMARAYGVDRALPGYRLVGLIGWDDFVLAAPDETTWRTPTVPLDCDHLSEIDFTVHPGDLAPDQRLAGRIKWYTKPIVFGGHPALGDNVTWVDMETHQNLVRWWNQKYLEVRQKA